MTKRIRVDTKIYGDIEVDDIVADDIEANDIAAHDVASDGKMVASSHSLTSQEEVVNVVYGTSETPPDASELSTGTLYIQYTP